MIREFPRGEYCCKWSISLNVLVDIYLCQFDADLLFFFFLSDKTYLQWRLQVYGCKHCVYHERSDCPEICLQTFQQPVSLSTEPAMPLIMNVSVFCTIYVYKYYK